MTTPPEHWKDYARFLREEICRLRMNITAFDQMLRMCLAADNYEDFLEAMQWFVAEEAEPDE